MKQVVLLLLMLSASTICRGQDVAAYNRLINQAELAITAGRFSQASTLYRRAITYSKGKAFGRDLMNAFHCAMDCGQGANAESYLKELLTTGIGSESIDSFLLKWYGNKDRITIKSWLRKYPNDTLKTSELARQIDRLFINDQEHRHVANARRDNQHVQDSMNRADSLTAHELYAAFVKHGVPDVKEIGYLGMSPLSHPSYWIIVLHNAQGYDGYTASHLFDTMLYRSISDWKISLPEFLTLLDNSDLFSRKPPCVVMDTLRICYPLIPNMLQLGISNDTAAFYLERFSPSTEQRMDKLRAMFGMETVAMTNKKFLYPLRKYQDPYGGKYQMLQWVSDIFVYMKKDQIEARLAQTMKQ